jgi:iron only hydrogenase large subunit-like protein
MASVFLSDLDGDWIAPAQACTNPIFTGGAKDQSAGPGTPAAGATLAGAEVEPSAPRADSSARPTKKLTLTLEVDVAARKPDLIKSVQGSGGITKAAVSVADCLACSGCVTSAETVLITQQSNEAFNRALASGAHGFIVVTMSPQSLASLATHMVVPLPRFALLVAAFWRSRGVHLVADTSVAADLSLLESSGEFVTRYRQRRARPWGPPPEISVAYSSTRVRYPDREGQPIGPPGSTFKAAEEYDCLPMLTSACPGWVCYAEKTQPNVLPYISTAKSAQQIMGDLVKGQLSHEVLGAKSAYHVTVMPCYDKKLEASRLDFYHEEGSAEDGGFEAAGAEVDLVLTTVEVLELIEAQAAAGGFGGDTLAFLESLPLPDAAAAKGSTLDLITNYNSTGILAPAAELGGSGGYAEFVFRYAARELFGISLTERLMWEAGRNDDLKELVLRDDAGTVLLRFALCYGFRNIQGVVAKMRRSACPYDFVEIMACPNGCLNGGAQIKSAGETNAMRKERVAAVQKTLDDGRAPREPQDSPFVQKLYGSVLGGRPFSEEARRLLHTTYHSVPKMETVMPMGIKW